MASPQVHHLFHAPIADHSFSTDKQTLAVARENNVELYQQSGNKFALSDELKGHEKTVTSVDIAPNSGRIVTCSQGWSLTLICLSVTNGAVQTATPTSGNRPPLAGSPPSSSSESIVLRPLCAGRPRSRNSPSAPAPE